ncbi:MAG TPA: amino acid ABC transporter permease [Mycobacteriales bacterium]|nr:amino acid ABC transporter permease [Mycobacteriales bacterium]
MTVTPGTGVTPPPALSAIELERRRYRANRARRSTVVALISTIVFAAILWVAVTHAPGWGRVRETYFSGPQFRSSFPDVLRGLWLNVRILVVAALLIVPTALLVATLRTIGSPVFFPVRVLMAMYVDVFRGIPLIVLLYLVGFGVPALGIAWLPKSGAVLGTLCLVLSYSAYCAEVFRAGILSVHPSQRAAARSLGLTQSQTMRIVVLPQAVRAVVPPLLNDFVSLQKDVGLVSILGIVDAVRAAQIDNYVTYNYTPYVVAALLFVLLAIPSARLADAMVARSIRRQQAGAIV